LSAQLTPPEPAFQVRRLQQSSGWAALNLADLWAHRELLYFLIWGDLKLRYKQTVLGAAWAVLQPFLTMLVFSLFFGKLAHMQSEGVPYAVFTYTALVPWTYFANTFNQASMSLTRYEKVITKVYFPRLIVPLAAVLSGLLDFIIAFGLLVIMLAYYGIGISATVWALPFFVAFTAVASLAVSLWLAALNVRYRDVRYAVPFLTQVWLFVTPIVYTIDLIPKVWRPVYALNPMVSVVEGVRWSLLGTAGAPGRTLVISAQVVLVLLVGGLYYFRRMERTFADIV